MFQRICRLGCLLFLLIPAQLRADDFLNPKANIPPKAKPERRNGGEGVPPLPLPATPAAPQREKTRAFASRSHRQHHLLRRQSLDGTGINWQTTIIDIEKWVEFHQQPARPEIPLRQHRFQQVQLRSLRAADHLLHRLETACPTSMTPPSPKLRQYLMDGGTWSFTAVAAGRNSTTPSDEEIARVFPDRELAPIPTDHPIYSSLSTTSPR